MKSYISVFRPAWLVLAAFGILSSAVPMTVLAKGGHHSLDDTAAQANAFLDRFQGNWTGSGDFEGDPIADALAIERILGDLYVQIRQDDLLGEFEAHMYFGFDAQEKQYELYVFGSFTGFGGNLPVRVMSGHRSSENVLVVEEEKKQKGSNQRLRYTFEFIDNDHFVLSKTWLTGNHGRPFVVELFERD